MHSIKTRGLSGQVTQPIQVKHDRNGHADIYFTAPRIGLLQKQDAYALALALVELADSLPEDV